MKLRNILAATALVAAIGANAQGIKYVINHNPEVDLSSLSVDKDGYYVLFDGKIRIEHMILEYDADIHLRIGRILSEYPHSP